ncbi:hypothetical protein [Desulfosarcina cetonica]|uniref:hypothetical protein n=1 Tax=Desulfosarcina cetonica TaxID=90730 RepID=UPI0012ED8B0F|nr:hypothetical protein [Desulfosarcina cetonica]
MKGFEVASFVGSSPTHGGWLVGVVDGMGDELAEFNGSLHGETPLNLEIKKAMRNKYRMLFGAGVDEFFADENILGRGWHKPPIKPDFIWCQGVGCR